MTVPSTATFVTDGGSVTAQCVDRLISARAVTPLDGWSFQTVSAQQGTRLKVVWTAPRKATVHIDLACQGGRPVETDRGRADVTPPPPPVEDRGAATVPDRPAPAASSAPATVVPRG